jgi:hypothetical protein
LSRPTPRHRGREPIAGILAVDALPAMQVCSADPRNGGCGQATEVCQVRDFCVNPFQGGVQSAQCTPVPRAECIGRCHMRLNHLRRRQHSRVPRALRSRMRRGGSGQFSVPCCRLRLRMIEHSMPWRASRTPDGADCSSAGCPILRRWVLVQEPLSTSVTTTEHSSTTAIASLLRSVTSPQRGSVRAPTARFVSRQSRSTTRTSDRPPRAACLDTRPRSVDAQQQSSRESMAFAQRRFQNSISRAIAPNIIQ